MLTFSRAPITFDHAAFASGSAIGLDVQVVPRGDRMPVDADVAVDEPPLVHRWYPSRSPSRGGPFAVTGPAIALGDPVVNGDHELAEVVPVDAGALGVTVAAATSILLRGDDLEMVDVHAGPISAQMVDRHPVGDWAAFELDDPTMGTTGRTLAPEDAVTPSCSACPDVASRIGIEMPVLIESIPGVHIITLSQEE